MHSPAQTKDDPLVVSSWMTTRGVGARVLVLDSGITVPSPHIDVASYRNFISNDPMHCHDDHGDFVCSTIASNSPQLLGVAPMAQLYVAKVTGGPLSWDAMCEALNWGIQNDVDVINMSIAFMEQSPLFGAMLAALDNNGVICVASHNPTLPWPHSEPSVISTGDNPNCNIKTSTRSHLGFVHRDGRPFVGSSVSCAYVSAMAACAKSYDKNINRTEFMRSITQ